MDRKEYEALLVVIEQTIETSISRRAKHFREYRRDTHPHGLSRLEKTAELDDRLYNDSDVDSGDSYLDGIGRLYRIVAKDYLRKITDSPLHGLASGKIWWK